MEETKKRLYQQLIESHIELNQHLSVHPLVKHYIEQEKNDIKHALSKFENDTFGICEFSGELIPLDIMHHLPTIRNTNEWKEIHKKFGKSNIPYGG
ncbi:hypothetical protein [Falsibacillus pallidus]|uniref:Uncharacterized protein n=1 Tax=Falsibacillus pallidus TaxID=493781 RepID=A0A370GWA0_9BACI|nr:hypothetical protein [Falsibacillus pallidus]RDI47530.1 hypothetical protein DFR59_101187 [Falsibacillus pallidus]